MNSFVGIEAVSGPFNSSATSVKNYNAVALDSADLSEISHWETICKEHVVPLYVLVPAGLNAFVFTGSNRAGEGLVSEYVAHLLAEMDRKIELAAAKTAAVPVPKAKRKQWMNPLLHVFLAKFKGEDVKKYYEKVKGEYLAGTTSESFEQAVKGVGVEFNPVAAVVGALVAQQIGQYVAQAKGYQKMQALTIYDSDKEISTGFTIYSLI